MDARDEDRKSAWLAADRGHAPVVRVLVDHGACVDLRAVEGGVMALVIWIL